MVAVQPEEQMVVAMSAWVTAGFTEPGVRFGSGSTAPSAVTCSAPVLSAAAGNAVDACAVGGGVSDRDEEVPGSPVAGTA
jgi:hypothetical protein